MCHIIQMNLNFFFCHLIINSIYIFNFTAAMNCHLQDQRCV